MTPDNLLHHSSPFLVLAHPTTAECIQIWTATFASWGDAFNLETHLLDSQHMTVVPLAKDGGMATWILVDGRLPPDERRIYCSCETFRKRALISDAEGKVEDAIVHGVASVFCPQPLRGRGYAQRHMGELRKVLTTWQADEGRKVLGSVLYSDIGKDFYAKLGWMPNSSNVEMVFEPVQANWPQDVRPIHDGDLQVLCHRDEQSIRAALSRRTRKHARRVVITPDLDHMLWHIGKESFATKQLFGKESQIRGAIQGLGWNAILGYLDASRSQKARRCLFGRATECAVHPAAST